VNGQPNSHVDDARWLFIIAYHSEGCYRQRDSCVEETQIPLLPIYIRHGAVQLNQRFGSLEVSDKGAPACLETTTLWESLVLSIPAQQMQFNVNIQRRLGVPSFASNR
jgi:hypothetical protein